MKSKLSSGYPTTITIWNNLGISLRYQPIEVLLQKNSLSTTNTSRSAMSKGLDWFFEFRPGSQFCDLDICGTRYNVGVSDDPLSWNYKTYNCNNDISDSCKENNNKTHVDKDRRFCQIPYANDFGKESLPSWTWEDCQGCNESIIHKMLNTFTTETMMESTKLDCLLCEWIAAEPFGD